MPSRAPGATRRQIGQRLRELRTRAGFTQESLALEAEMDRTYINSIENGRRNVTVEALSRIARALGCSLRDFFSNKMFDR